MVITGLVEYILSHKPLKTFAYVIVVLNTFALIAKFSMTAFLVFQNLITLPVFGSTCATLILRGSTGFATIPPLSINVCFNSSLQSGHFFYFMLIIQTIGSSSSLNQGLCLSDNHMECRKNLYLLY
jgi:hypothetical protein